MTFDPPQPSAEPDQTDAAAPWRELVCRIGQEVAEPLSIALERVVLLSTTGRIDRDSLRALRQEIERARRVGLVSQQVARFATKRTRQSHERLDLAQTLQTVVAYRGRELTARGLRVTQQTRPIHVLADPALLFTLFNAVIDWSVDLARSDIDFGIDLRDWPLRGRMTCSFAFEADDGHLLGELAGATLDSVNWQLILQTSRGLEAVMQRDTDAARVQLSIEFPRTLHTDMGGMSAVELDSGETSGPNSRPLAGHQVLVIADDRSLRTQVRGALADMGLAVDFAASVAEASAFCREGLPNAIVFDHRLDGDALDRLLAEIDDELAGFVFIGIADDPAAQAQRRPAITWVDLDRVAQTLPSMLVMALSRSA